MRAPPRTRPADTLDVQGREARSQPQAAQAARRRHADRAEEHHQAEGRRQAPRLQRVHLGALAENDGGLRLCPDSGLRLTRRKPFGVRSSGLPDAGEVPYQNTLHRRAQPRLSPSPGPWQRSEVKWNASVYMRARFCKARGRSLSVRDIWFVRYAPQHSANFKLAAYT